MKNIHVLPTDKETRLFTSDSELILAGYPATTFKTGKNIYITSDEEITPGYWLDLADNSIIKATSEDLIKFKPYDKIQFKKIILTTDQDLIKDGVQSIDDDFLEWFVKNPSCEKVEVEFDYNSYKLGKVKSRCYKIIIPIEEPKQETLEEAADRYSEEYFNRDEIQMRCSKISFIDGYKLAQEQILDFLYSEITERRDYSASKMCEKIIEFIKNK